MRLDPRLQHDQIPLSLHFIQVGSPTGCKGAGGLYPGMNTSHSLTSTDLNRETTMIHYIGRNGTMNSTRTVILIRMSLLIHQNTQNCLERCCPISASLSSTGPLQKLELNMDSHESLVTLSCRSQFYSLFGVGMEIHGSSMYIRIFRYQGTSTYDKQLRYAPILNVQHNVTGNSSLQEHGGTFVTRIAQAQVIICPLDILQEMREEYEHVLDQRAESDEWLENVMDKKMVIFTPPSMRRLPGRHKGL